MKSNKQFTDIPTSLEIEEMEKETQKQLIRTAILHKAGDTQSLLGTTADGTQLALYQLAEIIDAIATSKTLAELKTKLAPRVPIAQQHLKRVKAGTVRLTFATKGVESVIKDIETRATSVSNVFIAVKK